MSVNLYPVLLSKTVNIIWLHLNQIRFVGQNIREKNSFGKRQKATHNLVKIYFIIFQNTTLLYVILKIGLVIL